MNTNVRLFTVDNAIKENILRTIFAGNIPTIVTTITDTFPHVNGKCIPSIKRAVFKLDLYDKTYDEKTKKTKRTLKKNPVLVTKVDFTDGTYTVVRNCKNDKIELVDAIDPVTKKTLGVKIASTNSKEAAIAYALFKRVFGKPNPNNANEYVSANMGNILTDIITNAWDQDYEEAISDIKKERAKQENIAKHKKIQEEAHARKVRKIAKQLRMKKEAEEYNAKLLTESNKKTKKSK